jgi:hypothetical protein
LNRVTVTKNSGYAFLGSPPPIAIHDNGNMFGQIIEVDIFLKRRHKGAKIA